MSVLLSSIDRKNIGFIFNILDVYFADF